MILKEHPAINGFAESETLSSEGASEEHIKDGGSMDYLLPVDYDLLYVVERYVRIHVAMTSKTVWILQRYEPEMPRYQMNIVKELLNSCAAKWKDLYDSVTRMTRVPNLQNYRGMVLELIHLRTFWIRLNRYSAVKRVHSYMRRFQFAVKTLWDHFHNLLRMNIDES